MPRKRMSVSAIEQTLGLQEGFLRKQGLSRDKIVSQKEAEFVESYGASLGESIARQLHQMALSGRANTASTAPIVFADDESSVKFGTSMPTLPLAPSDKGPYTTADSVGAYTSSARYAAELLHKTQTLESKGSHSDIISLDTRRPDIGPTLLTGNATSREFPIIEDAIRVLQNYIEEHNQGEGSALSASELAATLRYPPRSLPYDEHFDTVNSILAFKKTSLSLLTSLLDSSLASYTVAQGIPTASAVPAFASQGVYSTARHKTQCQAAGLSSSQSLIITEAPYFATYILDRFALTQGSYGWQGSSFAEVDPWIDPSSFAFLIPAVGLTTTVWGTSQTSISLGFEDFTLRGWNHQGDYYWQLNSNCEEECHPYTRCPLFQYVSDDNSDIDLSSPVRGSFNVQASNYSAEFTVDIVLSTNDASNEHASTLLTSKQQGFFPYNYDLTASLAESSLNQVDVFSQQAEISIAELQSMLCAAGSGSSNTSVVVSQNASLINKVFTNGHSSETFPAPYHYGAVFIHGGKLPRLFLDGTDPDNVLISGLVIKSGNSTTYLYDRFDRMNRMVRLQRWTGLAFDQLDFLVTSAMRAEGATTNLLYTMNAHTLRTLGVYRIWQARYGVSATDLGAFLYQISPFAVAPNVPPLDLIFNSGANAGSAPFIVDNGAFSYATPAGSDYETIRQLCAGLQINEATFMFLAPLVYQAWADKLGLSDGQLTRSFEVISSLYRLCRVARYLGITPVEMVVLLRMMGGDAWVQQFSREPHLSPLGADGQPTGIDFLDILQALSELVDWMTAHSLDTRHLLWLLANDGVSAERRNAAVFSDALAPLQVDILDWQYDPEGEANNLSITWRLTCIAQQALNNIALDLTLSGMTMSGHDISFAPQSNLNNTAYISSAWTGITGGTSLLASSMIPLPQGERLILDITITGDAITPEELHTLNASFTATVTLSDGNTQETLTLLAPALPAWSPLGGEGAASANVTSLVNTVSQQLSQVCLTANDFTTGNLPQSYSDEKTEHTIDWITFLQGYGIIDTNNLLVEVDAARGLQQAISSALTGWLSSNPSYTFDDIYTESGVAEALYNIVAPAGLRQQSIANTQLALYLSSALNRPVSQRLVPALLRWAGGSDYVFLAASLEAATSDEALLRLLFNLQRVTAIALMTALSVEGMTAFLLHPAWWGLNDAAPSLGLLSALFGYQSLCQRVGKEHELLRYLEAVNTEPRSISSGQASAWLAGLLGIDAQDIQSAADAITDAAAGTGVLTNTQQLITLLHLLEASAKSGLSMTPLLEVIALPLLPDISAEGLREDAAAWQQAALAVGATLVPVTPATSAPASATVH
ncbi:Tc toxin subunit A [Pseudomonas chlororaphis]|uniref:Tc toxin subunit A n=1 Tax=Pseudomonas chlororaphis TaxID=587753 RepID=UPI00167C1DD9|nr:Tc toxin subunit A [Pseudomonas chlororaphis]